MIESKFDKIIEFAIDKLKDILTEEDAGLLTNNALYSAAEHMIYCLCIRFEPDQYSGEDALQKFITHAHAVFCGRFTGYILAYCAQCRNGVDQELDYLIPFDYLESIDDDNDGSEVLDG